MNLVDPEREFHGWAEHSDKLRILDLCCGMHGWTQAFIDRGHEVVSVDIQERFNPTIADDVMNLDASHFPGKWDVILASPPCEKFSIASCRHNWTKPDKAGNREPKNADTEHALEVVWHIRKLIEDLKPTFWAMENPRAILRKVWEWPTLTTFFAAWGDPCKKPTDIWGNLPETMPWPNPRCWELAPRGSRTGTQGRRRSDERAVIPFQLSFTLCIHAEIDCGISGDTVKPEAQPVARTGPKQSVLDILALLVKAATEKKMPLTINTMSV
jgi:hypothetical protein